MTRFIPRSCIREFLKESIDRSQIPPSAPGDNDGCWQTCLLKGVVDCAVLQTRIDFLHHLNVWSHDKNAEFQRFIPAHSSSYVAETCTCTSWDMSSAGRTVPGKWFMEWMDRDPGALDPSHISDCLFHFIHIFLDHFFNSWE